MTDELLPWYFPLEREYVVVYASSRERAVDLFHGLWDVPAQVCSVDEFAPLRRRYANTWPSVRVFEREDVPDALLAADD